MTDQEIFVFEVKKKSICNDGAHSVSNHLKLKLEQSFNIKSCHIDSVSFVPDNETYIVTVVVSNIEKF